MAEPRNSYSPAPSITPEQARDLRARAWQFVFQCHDAKKKGGPETAPDAGKEINERSGKVIIPK